MFASPELAPLAAPAHLTPELIAEFVVLELAPTAEWAAPALGPTSPLAGPTAPCLQEKPAPIILAQHHWPELVLAYFLLARS